MNEIEVSSQIEELLMVPFYLSISAGVLEFLAVVLMFAGVIIIFTSSKRPGRIMMLVGLAFSTLSYLPYLFGEPDLNAQKIIISYLPIVSGLFACLGCFGFFKFALSFKNES